ncbi:pimeloyl-ACP methyl ester carboxylesterase [Saccharothrix carnea]|uniref:Pimeloyl-ACP methyl ester carboxylesterase n=1 Tax=Saccharothrix carnea TaxID=1280637 RepID=A0A2P8I208_SACCR|nr:alpha/beta fold hydrolase [Saccharothrix carnea]PSL52507.1 pimeloyl-ACP methyl ester carboxylesterase [Saccharothrix carnea]
MNDRKPTKRRVVVRGLSTLFYEAGEGSVVLLVPGIATDPQDWFPVMTELALTHRVIALSLPGLGGTSPVPDVRPVAMASFVADFLDVLEVDTVVAVGHSFGGLVVAELALRNPSEVSRLVLVDASGLGRAVHPVAIALALLPERAADLASAVVSLPGGAAAFVLSSNLLLRQPWRIPVTTWAAQFRLARSRQALRTSLEVFRQCAGITGQRDDIIVIDRLHEITVPTLVIWGGLDQLLPAWQGWAAARRLPAGRFALLAGAGHVSYLDSHEEFIDALGSFIRDDLEPTSPNGRRNTVGGGLP